MKGNIKIPMAFQIRLDDVAWHIGHDERTIGKPSRTGIPRHHHSLDYTVINELGKALDMKINCAIVLGEWDKSNILRGQNSLTWDPDGWDRASQIDMEYAEKAFEHLEGSEYIDYTLHGVMHGHYDKGLQVTEREFYTRIYDKENNCYTKEFTWQTDDEVRLHLDYFYKLYDMWGFKKKIRSFACGNGCYGSELDEGNIRYAEIFKEYGLDVWKNSWAQMTEDVTSAVISGMVALRGHQRRGKGSIPWNAFDVDPDYLDLFNDEEVAFADYSIHWPNILRWNPEKNMEYLPKWVNYFKRQSEVFGTMIAQDVIFAASQAVYNRYSKISFEEGKCIIDLSNVDEQRARALSDKFYLSFRCGYSPKGCIGGEITEYEKKSEFTTYCIERKSDNKIIISL